MMLVRVFITLHLYIKNMHHITLIDSSYVYTANPVVAMFIVTVLALSAEYTGIFHIHYKTYTYITIYLYNTVMYS